MNQDEQQPKIAQLMPDPVQTIFADGLHNISALNGCVRIEFFTEHVRPDNRGQTYPAIAGRVVMPQSRLAPFIQAIGELAKRLETQRRQGQPETQQGQRETQAETTS